MSCTLRSYLFTIDYLMKYGDENILRNKKISFVTSGCADMNKSKVSQLKYSVAQFQYLKKFSNLTAKQNVLRSAITGFLSSAGFGSIVLPLINMNVLAEQGMKDVKIHEVHD